MSDQADLFRQIDHFTGNLQGKVLRTESKNIEKPNLHWGQFIVEPPRDEAQVGVYGSSCAAIIAKARDDEAARRAREELLAYVKSGTDASSELAHNIKLAMVVLALAPLSGNDADQEMLDHLSTLLSRCSQGSKLWPAYTRPTGQATVQFVERDSEVATSIILILLDEVHRCLKHPSRYTLERGQIEALAKESASRLEQAYASQRRILDRWAGLISSAVILVKGRTATGAVRRAFREAVRTRDFADRRVFFYDCLRDGTFTRDYFIVPAAVVLPVVAGKVDVKSIDRALAFVVAQGLVKELDDDGTFRAGQELSSTVEQALVYLSLQSVRRGQRSLSTALDQAAVSWLHVTQSGPTGAPTKLIGTLVVMLWLVAAAAILGKLVPVELRSAMVLSQIYAFASSLPDPVTSFLGFLLGALPASKALFTRIMGKAPQ